MTGTKFGCGAGLCGGRRPGSPSRFRNRSSRDNNDLPEETPADFCGYWDTLLQPSLGGAKATKQSIHPSCRAMDCFASLAMTVANDR